MSNAAFPPSRDDPVRFRDVFKPLASDFWPDLIPSETARAPPDARRPVLKAWGSHICLLLLVLGLVIVGPHHKSWFDEAQAWLIARDDNPWTILVASVRREGSPALWHLLLWGLEKLGLPYAGLWTVSATLAVAGAVVTLYRSPFPLWLRAGIVFAYFNAYQFAIVSRSYALDLLIFPLLALAWGHRRSRPVLYCALLGLAANTNAHSFVLAAALATSLLWEFRASLFVRRDLRRWLAIGVYALLALAAVAQAWPSADVVVARHAPGPGIATFLFKEALVNRADPFLAGPPTHLSNELGFALSFLAFLPIRLLCEKARLSLTLVGGAAAFMVLSALELADALHAGLLFLYIMALLWMAWPALGALTRVQRAALWVALGVVVACQDAATLFAWRYEVRRPYSAAPAAAQALVAELRTHPSERVAALGARTIAMQPWLDRNVFANHAGGGRRPAYYLWSRAETLPQLPSPALWRGELAKGYDLLVLGEMQDQGPDGLAPYVAEAAARGYRLAEVFEGRPQWRGYPIPPDDIYFFRPASADGRGATPPGR